jgi:Zn-dependent membrane protease YugP
MYFGGYGLYLLISLPALILGIWAQAKVKSAFNKYSRMRTYLGLTGAEIARRMLNSNGLQNVQIEQTQGMLSDHYDPRAKVLRLSPEVYQGNSIAAAGVAAHEAGHALQDQEAYTPLKLRSAMVPSVQIGSYLGPIIFFVGLLFAGSFGNTLAWVGIALFGGTALFALVTLPVELNASNRARTWLSTSGVVMNEEMNGVSSMLSAAAMTYVAAAVQALSTLLYYVLLLSGRRRD